MLARVLDVVLLIAILGIFLGAEVWATICDDWPVAIIACAGGLVSVLLPLMAAVAEKEGEGRITR
ncbi:hypothetical protein QTN79_01605 [Candidatus Saccharibacteria bacterium oral taxon 488]|nr:hypothetical protein [Candidatus Saccharibacteria bacterium]